MTPGEAVFEFVNFYMRDASPQRSAVELAEIFCKQHKLELPPHPVWVGHKLVNPLPADPPRGG